MSCHPLLEILSGAWGAEQACNFRKQGGLLVGVGVSRGWGNGVYGDDVAIKFHVPY